MSRQGARTSGTKSDGLLSGAFLLAFGLLLAVAASPTPAAAGEVHVRPLGNALQVPIVSLWERRWSAVVRQQRDFSCGAAVVATLLSYHYDRPTVEQEVFAAMWNEGDQPKIMRQGFSLLDMKSFLERRGYRADGYRVTLDKLAEVGVPAIVLIDLRGYRHFVLIKGITPHEVLIGDPARGLKRYPREEFEALRTTDVVFVVRNHVRLAQQNFNLKADWYAIPGAPIGDHQLLPRTLAPVSYMLPGPNEF
ncbi:MAG: C39 family peptidase [Geminicoccales bacterium]